MKKTFGILAVSAVIIGLNMSFPGMALVSQASPNEHSQKPDIHKPVPAANVEVIKKATIKGQSVGKGKPATSTNAATGILGALPPSGAQKYAIVIGISDYPGTAYDLKYADDDARDMVSALATYGFSSENIYSFIDEEGQGAKNATRGNILNTIDNLQDKVVAGDEVVFFFSGHGGTGNAYDGDTENIDESIISHDGINLAYIWDGELKQLFEGYKTSRIVFIFDSCVAGGMTDLAATGRIINMATTETGTAYEFADLQNGQFSYYFVDKGMLQGLADKYDYIGVEGPEPATIEEAFDYAKISYPPRYKKQGPTISDSFPNDLLL